MDGLFQKFSDLSKNKIHFSSFEKLMSELSSTSEHLNEEKLFRSMDYKMFVDFSE